MNIFILEDNEQRIGWFKEQLAEEDITIVKTASLAKETLKENTFDRLYLDHDLGNNIGVNPDDAETGTAIVRYIIKNNLQRNAIVYVHSLNPISFDTMVFPLNKAGYRTVYKPFSIMYEQCKKGNRLL